ncbi:MAG: hypothetical protein NVS4B2_05890 [Chloroflexota bacterium]
MTAPPRPAPAAIRPYRFPHFERFTLTNGLRVTVAPVHKLPIVTALLAIDAGAASDLAGREGTALLTARLLVEGTDDLDGGELATRFENLGASVDTSADWDAAVARLTVLSDRLDPAFRLFAQTIREPAFPERELERLRGERISQLLQIATEPRGLADEMFTRFLYASSSRYALPAGGSETTVRGLTREAVVAMHALRYEPGSMTLVLAGDVTVARARALATAAFGDMEPGQLPPTVVDDRPARTARGILLVAKADAPQSEIRIGQVGVPRTHPDYFAITILNAILGGLFSSRINLNLRERNAFTYGAHSEFDWRKGAGPFDVSTAVRSDVTAAAAAEILAEVDRIRSEIVDATELSLATSYLDGVFPIRYETTVAIASALANLEIYGLPANYFDTYRTNIRAVTTGSVLRAAQLHLHSDHMQMVVVGDPATVQSPLEALGFGPITLSDGMS